LVSGVVTFIAYTLFSFTDDSAVIFDFCGAFLVCLGVNFTVANVDLVLGIVKLFTKKRPIICEGVLWPFWNALSATR
jgi:hypothetical protein